MSRRQHSVPIIEELDSDEEVPQHQQYSNVSSSGGGGSRASRTTSNRHYVEMPDDEDVPINRHQQQRRSEEERRRQQLREEEDAYYASGRHNQYSTGFPSDYQGRRRNRPRSIFDMMGGSSFFGDDDDDDDFFGSRSSLMMPRSMMRMGSIFDEMERSIGDMMLSGRSGGNGGGTVFYSSTTSTTSSNGVTETTRSVKDSRSGTERVSVHRKVGDKSHTIEKILDHEGREQTVKKLENITEEEEDQFESDWQNASQSLPSWRRVHPSVRSLGGSAYPSSNSRYRSIEDGGTNRLRREY